MDDGAAFLDDDLGDEGLGAVFASPSNIVPIVVVPIGRLSRHIIKIGTTWTLKYDNVVPRTAKIGQNEPKMVRHETRRKLNK